MAEVLKGAFPAINPSAYTALITAELNDVGVDYIYVQQVIGYGRLGDILLGISTSGNSCNVLVDCWTDRQRRRDGGYFRYPLMRPAESIEGLQDIHTVLYHLVCAALENELWGD